MKVHIYPEEDGRFSIMLLAAPGKGRPPQVVHHIALDKITEVVEPLVAEMRRPKVSPLEVGF